jgi:hypothetical protein
MGVVEMAHSRDVLDKIADPPAKLNLALNFLSSQTTHRHFVDICES